MCCAMRCMCDPSRSSEAMLLGLFSSMCPMRRSCVHSCAYSASFAGKGSPTGWSSRNNCSSLHLTARRSNQEVSCGFIPNPPSTFARCRVTSNLVMRSSIPSRPVLEKTMSSTMAFIRDSSPKGLYRSDKLWSTNVTGSTCTPFVNPPLIRACGGMVSISSLAPPRSADATYAAFRATGISSRIDHSITSRVQFRKGN